MLDLTHRFKLEAEIGKGGFGAVWRAQDLHLRRVVAIKLMEPGGSAGSPISSALDHAQALARVNHPNIVRIYDVGSLAHPVTGEPWNAIVMELIDGPRLAELLAGELSSEQADGLGRGLLDGLEALHKAGVAHSDLHDGNIMLHDGIPKIIDVLYRGTLEGAPEAQRDILLSTDIKRLRHLISSVLVRAAMMEVEALFRRLSEDAEDVASLRGAFERAFRSAPSPDLEPAPSPTTVSPRPDRPTSERHRLGGLAQLGSRMTDAMLWGSHTPQRPAPPPRDVTWAGRFLAPGTLPRPRANNPATFLNPRYAAIPFHTWLRDAELTRLRAWCEDDSPTAITIIAGPGGVGKTRLVLALCDWAREHGFVAGFVPQHATREDLEGLLAVDGDVLAVVDYAEARTEIHAWLEHVPARRDPPRLRIVLIVRTLADWWQSLLGRCSTELSALLERDPPLLLSPDALSPAARTRVFTEATAHLAEVHGVEARAAVSPDLSAPHFGKTLFLHMAALATVEHRQTPPASLLEETLRHERRFWSRQLVETAGADDAVRRAQHELDLGVAAFILAGGARDEVHALDLLTRAGVAEPLRRPLLTRLGDMYPGTGQPGAANRYLSPLEPDLLAEAHIVAVLLHRAVPGDWVVRLFAGSAADCLRPALQLLGRLFAADKEALTRIPVERLDTVLRDAVNALVADELAIRAPVALDVAAALAERELRSPLAEVLLDNLRRAGTPALAAKLARHPHSQAVALRPIEAWIGETLLASGPADPSIRFFALLRMGCVKLAEDDFVEARRCFAEAVVASRASVEQNSSAAWMHALGNGMLGVTEAESGDIDQALATTRESLRLYEDLEARAPGEHEELSPFIRAMYAIALHHRGDNEAAVAVLSELVPRLERLATEHPGLTSMHALCEFQLGVCLGAAGRRSDGAVALRHAVERQRALVEEHQGSELGNLARSLTFLGDTERLLGNIAGARQLQHEAVALWEELARVHPSAANSGLAFALRALANAAMIDGDGAGARAAARRSVELFRDLVAAQPDTFTPQLAMSLTLLGTALVEPDEAPASLAVFDEALAQARPFAERSPALFRPLLAHTYMAQGLRLAGLDDSDGAVAALSASLTILRELSSEPDADISLACALAATLLASALLEREAPAEAAAMVAEALAQLDHVPNDGNPFRTFVSGWARFTQANALDELDDEAAAVESFEQCLGPLRDAMQLLPGTSWLLVQALDQYASLLDDRDAQEAGDAKRCEAIALLRSLHAAGESVADMLPGMLIVAGLRRQVCGDPDGARDLFLEAESHLRALPVGESFTDSEHLLECLTALGMLEPDPERRLERLREAVRLSLARPADDRRNLVRHLERLVVVGVSLASLDCVDEALTAVQAAITRGQAAPLSVEMLVSLAEAHGVLAELLVLGDDPEPSLAAMRSSVQLWRQLFAHDPDAFREELAESLESLSELLADAGLDDDAARADEERRVLVAAAAEP